MDSLDEESNSESIAYSTRAAPNYMVTYFSNLNDNSINLYRNEQKILLNDYNEKQSFDKQLGNSKYIINVL